LNYYSALKINHQEEFWPADLHIIGKEILWFHTVVWQAILLSAEISLPKKILVHSFYTIDGQKMSKSIGNVITPEALIKRFGVDGTRYLIASSFPLENDADVGWTKFSQKYNADLANGLGNLVARVAKLCEKSNFNFKPEKNQKFYPQIKKSLDRFRLDEALAFIWQEKITADDKLIDQEKPWQLSGQKLKTALEKLIGEIRQIAFNLKPFLPETAAKIEKQFAGPKIKAEKPLFPRIETGK